jgi:hypothetical protein
VADGGRSRVAASGTTTLDEIGHARARIVVGEVAEAPASHVVRRGAILEVRGRSRSARSTPRRSVSSVRQAREAGVDQLVGDLGDRRGRHLLGGCEAPRVIGASRAMVTRPTLTSATGRAAVVLAHAVTGRWQASGGWPPRWDRAVDGRAMAIIYLAN